MKNYLFDVKVFVTIRLDATNEAAARAKLSQQLDGEGWTPDGEADLIEVDGEHPDSIPDDQFEDQSPPANALRKLFDKGRRFMGAT